MLSPCIGICSTSHGDEICRGCFRTSDEIIHWNQSDADTKGMYYKRLNETLALVVPKYLIIYSPDNLQEYIKRYSLRSHPLHNIYTQSLTALRHLVRYESTKGDTNPGFTPSPSNLETSYNSALYNIVESSRHLGDV